MSGTIFMGPIMTGLLPPQIPDSPCPQFFQYQSNIVPGDTSITVTGLLSIAPPTVGVLLYLLVHLQLKAVLPSKYVGLIELVDRGNLSMRSQMLYRVRFPLSRPLPTVRQISVNYQVICSGVPASGSVVTDIRLEHTLRRILTTTTTSLPTTNKSPITYFIDPGGECGHSSSVNPLVVGGRLLERGDWPWLVAIFVLSSLGLEFHCSGNIITRSFIITVGHCMHHEEAGTMKPSDVVVYLGKFNLQQWEEPYSVIKEVSEIHVHPYFDPNKYTADLALLKLNKLADYNRYVQPVCLWSLSTELDPIVGRIATVVGWGKDNLGNNLSATPKILEMPIVSTEECVNSHSEFFYFTSPTTLCAGSKNGVGPCNGDSGGGLMLPVTDLRNNTRWQLRGLVSLSLLNATSQSCDLNQYFIFTDTAKFLSWIASVINS